MSLRELRQINGVNEIILGTLTVAGVALWDVLLFGIGRGFFQYAIHWRGTMVILGGVCFIWAGILKMVDYFS